MSILIIRLKAIKYKENSFCYLSSYPPDFSLQAACLLILFFRLYAFKTFISSAERIYSPKPSRILDLFYNLNFHLLDSSLTPKKPTSFVASALTKYQGAILVASSKPYLLPLAWWFQRPKALCRSRTLSYNHASYWLRLRLAIRWLCHWLANRKALSRDLDPNGI